MHGIINLDFQDVGTVLRDGGVALMSTGFGEGTGRVTAAINEALHSPLLNNNDIFNSRKILLSITFAEDETGVEGTSAELMMEEMNEVHDFMGRFRDDVETKFGLSTDPSLGKKVKVTILATGFGINAVAGMQEKKQAEAAAEVQKNKEKQEEYEERRSQFYGYTNNHGVRKHFYKTFIFQPEDCENDELVALVEAVATSRRTKENLADIKSKSFKPNN